MSEEAVEQVETERVERPAREMVPSTGSTNALAPSTKMHALALMTDDEFEKLVVHLKKGRERVKRIQRELMTETVHFGKVPGRENDKDAKHGLLKAGAELLLQLYGYVADVKTEITYGDPANVESPAVRVLSRCEVHAGSLRGLIVGVGVGESNSWESKYRYRNASRVCPRCGKPALIRSKFPERDGPLKGVQRPWLCFDKKGGCGAAFHPEDKEVTDQAVGRVANEDILDLGNTLVKMSAKRAKVDGTIAATGSSDLFTQDVEDMKDVGDAPAPWPENHTGPAPPAERNTAAAEARAQVANPPKTAAAATAKNGGQDLPASDAQIRMIRGIASGLGWKDDAAITKAITDHAWGVSPWPKLTAREAAKTIDSMKTMSASRGAAQAKKEAEPPSPKTVADAWAVIDDNLGKIATENPGRQFIAKSEDEISYLVDAESLRLLGFKDFKAIDELSLEELVKWGKWLHFQPGAAPVSPQGKGGR